MLSRSDGSSNNSPNEQLFDPERFYIKILLSAKDFIKYQQQRSQSSLLDDSRELDMLTGDDEDELALQDRMLGAGMLGFDAKQYQVRRKEFKKRKLNSATLYLCGGAGNNGFCISVAMYKLMLPAKRPSSIWLHRGTNMPTKSVSVWLDNTTGAVVDELQLSKYIDYNGTYLHV